MSQSAYAALWGLKVKEAIKLSGRLHDLPDAVTEKKGMPFIRSIFL